MELQPHDRERYRTRNKLLNLSIREDPQLGKHDELVVREMLKAENERNIISDDKRELCIRLASCAWQSVHGQSVDLSCVKIALTLDRIYQSATAVEYYALLLCRVITNLCAEQVIFYQKILYPLFRPEKLTSKSNNQLTYSFLINPGSNIMPT